MKFLYPLLVGLILMAGCNSKYSDESTVAQPPKTLLLKSYTIPKLTLESQKAVENWLPFRSLYQVMVNLAPNNLISDPSLSVDKDSLVVYKRLYSQSSKLIRNNSFVDKDWHTPKTPTDTIYRLSFDDKTKEAFVEWNEKLVKDIPYTLGVHFWVESEVPSAILRFTERADDENFQALLEQKFPLDTLTFQAKYPNASMVDTGDSWRYTELTYTPNSDGTHQVQIVLPASQDSSMGQLLYYSPVLKIKEKDVATINSLSSDLVEDAKSIRSSYNSVYFWLQQLEDELHLLLAKNEFPDKIDSPIIRSRFHLLDTRIKDLKAQVKNNSDLEDEKISQQILTLEEGFGSIVQSINTVYSDGLETLMETATKDLERILDEISQSSSTLEDLEKIR